MLKIAVQICIAVCGSCGLTAGVLSTPLCALQLINSRAAMLGFAFAIIGYQTTGKNVW